MEEHDPCWGFSSSEHGGETKTEVMDAHLKQPRCMEVIATLRGTRQARERRHRVQAMAMSLNPNEVEASRCHADVVGPRPLDESIRPESAACPRNRAPTNVTSYSLGVWHVTAVALPSLTLLPKWRPASRRCLPGNSSQVPACCANNSSQPSGCCVTCLKAHE